MTNRICYKGSLELFWELDLSTLALNYCNNIIGLSIGAEREKIVINENVHFKCLELFWRRASLVTSTYMLKANFKELLMRNLKKITQFKNKIKLHIIFWFYSSCSSYLRDRVLTHYLCSFFQDVMHCVFHLSKRDPPKTKTKKKQANCCACELIRDKKLPFEI
jgi:hypothetical protein